MKQALLTLCAAALFAGAGCEWDFGNTLFEADVKVNDHALDATVEEAAVKVQKELQKRGLEAAITYTKDGTRVTAKTRSGDQFAVVLTQTPGPSGRPLTRLRVEWGAVKADRELWLGLMLAVGASAVQAAS
jgi:hypothetical protein